jgi:hypothetical protein
LYPLAARGTDDDRRDDAGVGSIHRNQEEPMRTRIERIKVAVIGAFAAMAVAGTAVADETCNSPYTTRLIKG